MNKINQLLTEIQVLKAKIHNIEKELNNLLLQENSSETELKLGDKVRVTNKVTIKSNLRRFSSTEVIGEVVGFTECFIKVEINKKILHHKLKGTKVIRREISNLQKIR